MYDNHIIIIGIHAHNKCSTCLPHCITYRKLHMHDAFVQQITVNPKNSLCVIIALYKTDGTAEITREVDKEGKVDVEASVCFCIHHFNTKEVVNGLFHSLILF